MYKISEELAPFSEMFVISKICTGGMPEHSKYKFLFFHRWICLYAQMTEKERIWENGSKIDSTSSVGEGEVPDVVMSDNFALQ
jgi:hypothetical protein